MTTSISTLSVQATLIDDHLLLDRPPVYPQLSPGCFAVARPEQGTGGVSDLVTLDTSGSKLLLFRADPISNSGWSNSSYSPGAGEAIESVRAFYRGGLLNVLAGGPAAQGIRALTWVQWDPTSASWTTLGSGAISPAAAAALAGTAQAEVYTDASGANWVYGVSAEQQGSFFVIGWNEGSGCWDLCASFGFDVFGGGLGIGLTSFRLGAPADSANSFGVAWNTTDEIWYSDAQLTTTGSGPAQGFAWNWIGSGPQCFAPGIGTISGPRWPALPAAWAATDLLLQDDTGQVWYFPQFRSGSGQAQALPLTGAAGQPAAISELAVQQDGAGNLLLFGIAADGPLWYLSAPAQTDPSPAAWVTLGDLLTTLGAAPSTGFGPELYAVDGVCDVFHIARTPNLMDLGDASEQVWVTQLVAAPLPPASTTAPQNIASYCMEVTAVDARGRPLAGRALTLTCDHAATVLMADPAGQGELAHRLAPGIPFPLVTDATGSVSVRIQGVDLKPPRCTFADPNGSASCWVQGDVVQTPNGSPPPTPPTSIAGRLQSHDPTRPVTDQALQQAITPPGDPHLTIAPLMAPGFETDGHATQAMVAMGAWLDPNHQTADGRLKAQTAPPDLTPAGLVAFFDQSDCPAGWSDYAAGHGRLLLGITNLTEYQLAASVGTALSGATPPTHSHSFSTSVDVGSQGLAGTKGGNDSGAAPGGHPVSGTADAAGTGWGFIQRTLCWRDPATALPQWDSRSGNLPAGTVAFFAPAPPDANQPCPGGWAPAKHRGGYQGSWSGTAGYCITVALDGTDADGDGVLRGRGSNPSIIQGNYPNELSNWTMIVWQGGCGPDSGGTQQMTYNWTDQQQRPEFNVNLDLASLAIIVADNWDTQSGIAMGLYTPGAANFNLGSYVPPGGSKAVSLQIMTPVDAPVSTGPLDVPGQFVFPVAVTSAPVNGVFLMPFAGADRVTLGRTVGTPLANLATAGVHSHSLASGITLNAEHFALASGHTEHLATPGWHPFTATTSSDDPGIPYLQLLLCRKTADAAAPPPPGLANLILYADAPCATLSGTAGQTWTDATADSGRLAVGRPSGAADPGQTFGGPALAPLAQPQHVHDFAGTANIEGHGVSAFLWHWFDTPVGDAADNVPFSGTTDPAGALLPYLAVSACRPCGGAGQPACP